MTGALVVLAFLILASDHAAVACEVFYAGMQAGAFGKRLLDGFIASEISFHVEIGTSIAGVFLFFDDSKLLFVGLFGLHGLLLPVERTRAQPICAGTVPRLTPDALKKSNRPRQGAEGEDGDESENEQMRHLKALR
jgi:hypothetical protein